MLIVDPERVEHKGPPVSMRKRHESVVTAFPLPTGAGLEILRAGRNVIDGAVAAAWTLRVCEPNASGMVGQPVLRVRFAPGRTQSIDGHARGPAVASLGTIKAGEQRRGHRACTIPLTPATLDRAQRNAACLAKKWNITWVRQIGSFRFWPCVWHAKVTHTCSVRDGGREAVWHLHDGRLATLMSLPGALELSLRFPERCWCRPAAHRVSACWGQIRSPLPGSTCGAATSDELFPSASEKIRTNELERAIGQIFKGVAHAGSHSVEP
ncbi:hypothetical protein GGE12_005453 [Rhizobium mongolense]|uniref:Uncharacterized protein n=2 Tax=Rhizobium mongolense TaxID=57676 RepID=A0A7W6RS41_9HYPH|nr:hypothetical protein [Rhizobium mongolense]